MKPQFNYVEERRPRTTFYASDYGKLSIDIILALNNVPPSNPMEWNGYLKMAAGKGVELQMLKILKQNGIVDEEYDQDFIVRDLVPEDDEYYPGGEKRTERQSTKIDRNGVTISMRFDAEVRKGGASLKALDTILPQGSEITMQEGEPIEIKSVNNKNSMDIQKYIDGYPKESYVGQLATYMDALGKDQGHLFVSSIDGQNYFWFVCKKTGEGIYQCGNTVVDLNKEYARFAELAAAAKNVWNYPIVEKYWKEVNYKLPLENIDWTKLSVSKIGDIRNGRFVVGDEDKWKIDYSPYKDHIIRIQGHTLGYSPEELAKIKEMTAGFSSKRIKVEEPVATGLEGVVA